MVQELEKREMTSQELIYFRFGDKKVMEVKKFEDKTFVLYNAMALYGLQRQCSFFIFVLH